MKMKNLLSLIVFSLIFFSLKGQPHIELQPFASGFTLPLDIVNADDDRLFVVQQRGLIRIVNNDGVIAEDPFLDLSAIVSQAGSERGLLGLAFHPQYYENGYFFVNYTREQDGHTVIARYTVDENNINIADPGSEKHILTIEQPYANHNGGQLLFGPDGYLYIPTGDGGSAGDPQGFAQDSTSLLGKILRIDIDVDDQTPYAIPPDNPFVNLDNVPGEIWALGLRNPWRNSFDRYTGDLWIADVGQSQREEVNFQPFTSQGGENYGWRCYEGNIAFNTEGCLDMTEYMFPVFDYEHQGTGCTGAVTGGYVYRGALQNGLFGYYILADYCTGIFYNISHTHQGNVTPIIGDFQQQEYTSFGQGRYGELYVALRNAGEIRRVVETEDCRPVAWIMEDDVFVEIEQGETYTIQAFFNPLLEYQWNRDEQPIEGETQYLIELSQQGEYTVTVTNPENECSNTSQTFEVFVGSVSISDPEFDDITFFPNPASNQLTIEGLPQTGTTVIDIIDITGKTLITETTSNTSSFTIITQSLRSGLYLLRMSNDADVVVRRVMVQK